MTSRAAPAMLPARCGADRAAEIRRLFDFLPPGAVPAQPAGVTFESVPPTCAVLDWARSGAMGLTGPVAGPTAPSAPVATRVAAALDVLTQVTGAVGDPVELSSSWLLHHRAAQAGLRRAGAVSANGTCRLVPAADGIWLAVSLSRPQDAEVVLSLVTLGSARCGEPEDEWAALAAVAARDGAHTVVDLLQLLEVPAAVLGSVGAGEPVRFEPIAPPGRHQPHLRPGPTRVVDLSAMWAGPLCGQILSRAGAQVVKVEDINRPDGARRGPAAFFADLQAGKEQVSLDFATVSGRTRLRELIDSADVVIESSRPRALVQLGIDAEAFLAARTARSWISITGYGRRSTWSNRVAFGDDAAVAGGLVARDAAGEPVFCGDAIADPITGVYAAIGAAASIATGGGYLVDVSMAGVSAEIARPAVRPADGPVHRHRIAADGTGWIVQHEDGDTGWLQPGVRVC